jgi:hypothetical protein
VQRIIAVAGTHDAVAPAGPSRDDLLRLVA